MPLSLPPIDRRRFLASLASSAGVLVIRPALAADADPHRVAFLSDSHVGEKPDEIDRACNMHDRLKQVVGEVLKLDPKPACAVVNGDLAHTAGTAAEYELFGKLIEPVRSAGIPLNLGLGNHDHFGRFAEGLDRLRPKDRPVDGKQVLVVELPRVNLVVLDSFDPKNTVGGLLGTAQLKWLATALDARKEKPAVVFAHHNLQFEPDKAGRYNGLADSVDLWQVLKDRPQVKAYVFGHTHTWKLAEKDGIHLINLPAIGYPFAKGEVTGWVDAAFTAGGVKLEVRAIDPKHPRHGEKVELSWRK
ncbi:MAG TPA: metallophosphoesterase [Gemmataceae bacterium]|nr:metallophosphoesterase [Gemmataceae bacterium]